MPACSPKVIGDLHYAYSALILVWTVHLTKEISKFLAAIDIWMELLVGSLKETIHHPQAGSTSLLLATGLTSKNLNSLLYLPVSQVTRD